MADATRISLPPGRAFLDRDFVLEVRRDGAAPDAARYAEDLDGYAALATFQPWRETAAEAPPRSVKVLVDCSASMAGDAIAQARAALHRTLDALRPDDRFSITAFGDTQRPLFLAQRPANDMNVAKARRFVDRLDADLGGTELGAALDTAFAIPGPAGIGPELLLITDGEVWAHQAMGDRVRGAGHRVFTVGVGSAVDEALVRALAEAGAGACELVSPNEDMAAGIDRQFHRIYAPVAKARVEWPGGVDDPVTTVFSGDTLHVFRQLPGRPADVPIRLRVQWADGLEGVHEAAIEPLAAVDSDLIARMAARDRIKAGGAGVDATATAVRYQLLTPETALLAVAAQDGAKRPDTLPALRQVPQMMAAGWGGLGSVHDNDMEFLDFPAFLLRDPDAGPAEPSTLDAEAEVLASLTSRSATPARFAAEISRQWGPVWRRQPPAASIAGLAACGLPPALVDALQEVVDRMGEAEETVVVAFLHILLHTPVGDRFSRHAGRMIRKELKARCPGRDLTEELEALLAGVDALAWGVPA